MNPAMIIIFFAQIFHLVGLDFIAAIFLSVICIISSTSGVTKPRSRREHYLLVQRIRSLCLDHLCIMCFISRVTPGGGSTKSKMQKCEYTWDGSILKICQNDLHPQQ